MNWCYIFNKKTKNCIIEVDKLSQGATQFKLGTQERNNLLYL